MRASTTSSARTGDPLHASQRPAAGPNTASSEPYHSSTGVADRGEVERPRRNHAPHVALDSSKAVFDGCDHRRARVGQGARRTESRSRRYSADLPSMIEVTGQLDRRSLRRGDERRNLDIANSSGGHGPEDVGARRDHGIERGTHLRIGVRVDRDLPGGDTRDRNAIGMTGRQRKRAGTARTTNRARRNVRCRAHRRARRRRPRARCRRHRHRDHWRRSPAGRPR